MKELEQDNLKDVIANENKVIVQFGASWCGMCRVIKPKFKKLSESHSDTVFLYVDAEKFPQSRELVKIDNLPTFAGFAGGKLIKQKTSSNETAIKEILDEIASN